MPWVLGCGGCGLLVLIVVIFLGGAFIRGFKEAARQGRTSSDTTVVTSDVGGDTTASGKPIDGGATTSGESTGKPGDESTSGEENLPEIRPVQDSTF